MLPFVDIESWCVNDTSPDVTKNGINVVCADGEYFFAVEVRAVAGCCVVGGDAGCLVGWWGGINNGRRNVMAGGGRLTVGTAAGRQRLALEKRV